MNATSSDAPQRACLPCTACCEGWMAADVDGHAVRPGHACPHLSNRGCGNYSNRPQVPCRQFQCSWVVDRSPLPDWMRPDLCGAIVLLSMHWRGRLVIHAVPVGDEIPDKTLQWLKDYAVRHRRPLMFYQRLTGADQQGSVRALGFGPPDFRREVAELVERGEVVSPTLADQGS